MSLGKVAEPIAMAVVLLVYAGPLEILSGYQLFLDAFPLSIDHVAPDHAGVAVPSLPPLQMMAAVAESGPMRVARDCRVPNEPHDFPIFHVCVHRVPHETWPASP